MYMYSMYMYGMCGICIVCICLMCVVYVCIWCAYVGGMWYMCSVYMYGLQGVCVIKCVYVWCVSQTKLFPQRVFSCGAGVGCHMNSNISKLRAGGTQTRRI